MIYNNRNNPQQQPQMQPQATEQHQYFRYTQQGQMQMPSPVISESCMVQSQIQEQHLNQQKLHQYQIMMLQQQTTKNHKMVRIC